MQSFVRILLLLLITPTTGYLTPSPGGKYNVALTTTPLIDYTRNETYGGTPAPRALMLSVFQPATCTSIVSVPYMPNKTAEFQGPFLQEIFDVPFDLTPLFLEAHLPVCPEHGATSSPQNDSPILLFSPGYSIPRLYYNVLSSAIASEGFTVITIDHPRDADIITYPDGLTVINNDTTQALDTMKDMIPARIADVSFVIDQLTNDTAIAKLFPRGSPRTDRVAMLGHSLGGVTAVLAAAKDPRLRGAINWDGTFLELPSESAGGVAQPVLLMSHGMADASWPAAWPLLKGPKLWVNVANATHESFSDVASLLQAAGEDLAAFSGLLGTIESDEMVRILVDYTTAWMNGVFADDMGKQEFGEFPKVSVVLKDNF